MAVLYEFQPGNCPRFYSAHPRKLQKSIFIQDNTAHFYVHTNSAFIIIQSSQVCNW